MRPPDLPQPFTRAEALEHGLTDRRLHLAVTRGDLSRILPGVYAATAPWAALPPWDQHRALAETARRTTPDAILSHTSAAALLGLPLPPRLPLRATLTLLDDSRTSESDAWRDFHRGATPPTHVVIRRGMPELVPARTVLDAVRVLRRRDGLAVLDGALRRGIVSRHQLREMRRSQRRWQGVTAFDALAPLTDPLRESWLESASALVMASWEVPLPIPQVVVLDADGRFVARVDALWWEQGVVGEADGTGKYGLAGHDRDPSPVVLDQLRREDRLRDLGLVVVRWSTPDLDDPLGLRVRVMRAFDRADPSRVRARFRCSCCQRDLTHCAQRTRHAAGGVHSSQ